MMTPPFNPSSAAFHSLNAQYWQCNELEASHEHIHEIAIIVHQAKNTNEVRLSPAPLWLGSWQRCANELQEQASQYQQQVARHQEQRAKQQAEILRLRTQISELQRLLADVEKEELETSTDLCGHES